MLLKFFNQVCVTLFVSFYNKLFIIISILHNINEQSMEIEIIYTGRMHLHDLCHSFNMKKLFLKISFKERGYGQDTCLIH